MPDEKAVPNVLHSGNSRGILACGELLLRRVHKAAEVNDGVDRLDLDLERPQGGVDPDGVLYPVCDEYIVRVLAGAVAIASARRRAATGQDAQS